RMHQCNFSPDCFDKLPYSGGYPTWKLGKGNQWDPINAHGSFQAYAFDFVAAQGTPILAARGGQVVMVEERDWLNAKDYPAGHPYFGNYIWIRHQDGTYTVYFHIPKNGSMVKQGDMVHRGDTIAMVGNTGQSSEPHLHFEGFQCFNC